MSARRIGREYYETITPARVPWDELEDGDQQYFEILGLRAQNLALRAALVEACDLLEVELRDYYEHPTEDVDHAKFADVARLRALVGVKA